MNPIDITLPGEKPRPNIPRLAVACRTCSDQGLIHIAGQPEATRFQEIFSTTLPCPQRCSASKNWHEEFTKFEQEVKLLGPEIAGTDEALDYWFGGVLYATKDEVRRRVQQWRASR